LGVLKILALAERKALCNLGVESQGAGAGVTLGYREIGWLTAGQ
jgi:hypothetical protein